MISIIYIDLDQTLVDGYWKPSKTRKPIKLETGETHHAILRPLTHKMLSDLRQVAQVKIFTTAAACWAMAVNNVYNLGFLRSNILCFEDCWQEISIGYGKDYYSNDINVDKQGVLIDNLWHSQDWPRRKMQYLGIGSDRYIKIRDFNGKDPECFEIEWNKIMETVKGLQNER